MQLGIQVTNIYIWGVHALQFSFDYCSLMCVSGPSLHLTALYLKILQSCNCYKKSSISHISNLGSEK